MEEYIASLAQIRRMASHKANNAKITMRRIKTIEQELQEIDETIAYLDSRITQVLNRKDALETEYMKLLEKAEMIISEEVVPDE